MNNQKAVTIIEMLVTLVVASFIMLNIGATLGLCNKYHASLFNQTGIQNDIFYGIKLMQNRIRKSESVTQQTASGYWLSSKLICNNRYAFGVYQPSGSTTKSLVYLPDKNDETQRTNIFTVKASDSLAFDIIIGGRLVTIRIYGSRNGTPFDITSDILRRG